MVFQALQDSVGLNTGPGSNQLSAFIQTKMLHKLRCREETLQPFSGNRLCKQRHMEILLLCRGRIMSKMCSAAPYLYWACHSRADFWVCLACGLVPGMLKWGGPRGLYRKLPYTSASALSKLEEQRFNSCRKSTSVEVSLKLVWALNSGAKALNPVEVPSSSVTSELLSSAYLERTGKFSKYIHFQTLF